MKKVIIKRGRFKGETFKIEGKIEDIFKEDCLPLIASTGNLAAINALEIDNYKYTDAPFYYGKIRALGYILSEKEWI